MIKAGLCSYERANYREQTACRDPLPRLNGKSVVWDVTVVHASMAFMYDFVVTVDSTEVNMGWVGLNCIKLSGYFYTYAVKGVKSA